MMCMESLEKSLELAGLGVEFGVSIDTKLMDCMVLTAGDIFMRNFFFSNNG